MSLQDEEFYRSEPYQLQKDLAEALSDAEVYQRELLQMRLELVFRALWQMIKEGGSQGVLALLPDLGPYALPLLMKLSSKVSQTVLDELMGTVMNVLILDPASVEHTDTLIRMASAELGNSSPW